MMKTRGKAAIIITVFAVMAVLIAGGAVTTVLLVKRAHHKNDIKKADKAAAKYNDEAENWQQKTMEALRDVKTSGSSGDYGEVAEVIEDQTDDVPKPGDAPSYGKKHSKKYKSAKKDAGTLTDGLDDISDAAKVAEEQNEWYADAYATVTSRPDRGLPKDLKNSKKLRKKILPRYKKEITRFDKLDTPDGAEDASKAIEGALKYAKNHLEKLADHIDSNKSYQTRYNKKYKPAFKALDKYSEEIGKDVKAAIDDFDENLSTDQA